MSKLPRTLTRPFLWSLLASAAGACAAPGPSTPDGQGRALRVSLLTGSGNFELVSTAHTSRVDLYSAQRDAASSKVQTDEVMEALVEHLGDLGYRAHARPGSAPKPGGSVATVIEVQEEGKSSWWGVGAGTPVSERKDFLAVQSDFLNLYNMTQGYQSITNEIGGDFFESRKRDRQGKD